MKEKAMVVVALVATSIFGCTISSNVIPVSGGNSSITVYDDTASHAQAGAARRATAYCAKDGEDIKIESVTSNNSMGIISADVIFKCVDRK